MQSKQNSKTTTASDKASATRFTDGKKAAMRERAQELKADRDRADGEQAVLAKIAEMPKQDRAMAERIHALPPRASSVGNRHSLLSHGDRRGGPRGKRNGEQGTKRSEV